MYNMLIGNIDGFVCAIHGYYAWVTELCTNVCCGDCLKVCYTVN